MWVNRPVRSLRGSVTPIPPLFASLKTLVVTFTVISFAGFMCRSKQ